GRKGMSKLRQPSGLVLAGGLARRMGGGDKALLKIGAATILERVLDRLEPQCARIILNANGDPARFAFTRLPVVADEVPDFAGPLAGVLAGLDWGAARAPPGGWGVNGPGACPFPPRAPGAPPPPPPAAARPAPGAARPRPRGP